MGLHNPVWRETVLIATNEVIESVMLKDDSYVGRELPEQGDIRTTVWYGSGYKKPEKKTKLRRNLMKGIQTATAIFLLEAMVLMTASAQWSGSWTQRLYGTGSADVWEVFGTHGLLTKVSWRQGWRPLEPLREAKFNDLDFEQYVTTTMTEHAPRLILMECPAKQWYNCTKPMPRTPNALRQANKKVRSELTPFLQMASNIAQSQLEDKHEFLLETPLTTHILRHPLVSKMTKDDRICVVNGTDLRKGKATWWLTSSPEISKRIEDSTNRNPPNYLRRS